MKNMRRVMVGISLLALSLGLAANAFAGKPAPYQGTAGAIQSSIQPGSTVKPATKPGSTTQSTSSAQPAATPTATTAGGTLPFTGADLGIFVAGGAMLLLVGFSLSRVGKRRAE